MNMKLNENVRGLRMIRQMIVALSFTSVAVFAGAVADNQNTIEQKVDSINAKRGVSIGGSIRAMHTGSHFSSDQDLDGINKFPDHERTEFVNADFDFTFRPWEFVRANATLRFEAGMQDYFAGSSKSISVPWLNAEGNIGTNFYWVIGNFREQYTPLTLFAPDVEIMYEPMVFARGRHMAKKQELLEGNQRNLQGVNLQFRASPNDAFGEIRAEAIFARLRRVQELDFSGEVGNIVPNDLISGSSQASNMDKWLLSGNLEWFPLSRNLLVGATGMWVFDDKSSFTYTYRHQGGDLNQPYIREPINPFDTLPQNTKIASARLGADVAGIMGNKNLILDLVGEFAMSFDEVYSQEEVLDSLGAPVMTAVSEDQNGKAILVNLNAGYKTDNAWGILLKGDFVSNDSAWFNNLAQSPQFFARRILNTDIDGNTIKYGVNSALYSTFGALYHFTPKY
ncbi:MAG: hypothetical protein LBR60_05515, partial [Fibrobacter sp.]|nr:hypothetical protein [Fibrobacter sp.]